MQDNAGQRRIRGVQDLSALDAVVPFKNGKSAARAEGSFAASNVPDTNRTGSRIQQRLTAVPAQKLAKIGAIRGDVLLALPGHVRRSNHIGTISFAVCVVLPTLIAAIYYCFLASPQYVAEFRFTVRDASASSQTSSATAAQPTFMSMMGMGTNPNTNNYLVTDYLTSRQIVDELQNRIKLIDLYSKPEADWWARFDAGAPVGKFVDYWKKAVTAHFDMLTGLAVAQVRAFTPDDALLIATTMVSLSEDLVNQMEQRSQADAVRFARDEVEKAENRLKEARARLTEYRSKFGVIDPNTSVTASNSLLIQQQRQTIAQLEMQLNTLLGQNLFATAPAVIALRNQIESGKEQLRRTEADVGRGINGSALSEVVGKYEQLSLEVQFAQTMVTNTMATLEMARSNAASQHLYVTPYVRPSRPDNSIYPRPFYATLSVAAMAFAVWIVLLMLGRSLRERFA
jgi:capsular polysaccharide transport system permease protein